jgi:hypothetical protein
MIHTSVPLSDRVKMHAEKQVEKQRRYLGTIKRQPGQIVWELNLDTGKMNPAVYDQSAVNMKGSIRHTLVTKENCLYEVAINRKNAGRKFMKRLMPLKALQKT